MKSLSIKKQTNILDQRIKILDRLNNIYEEIYKLEQLEYKEKGDTQAIEAQIRNKRKEWEELQEVLRNFDMHYIY